MGIIRLERQENESRIAHHKRLVYGKLVDKTLADLDYTELAEAVYGQAYSSDVARRMMYGSKRTLELLDKEAVSEVSETSSKSILSELDEKMAELRKERQKFYDQRREYNKILSAEARAEHLQEALISAANNLGDSIGRLYNKTDGVFEISATEAVLVLSDWHFGLKTSNVFNKYDTEICKQRVNSVVEAAASRLKLHRCGKLHIVILGDLFHGGIHTSARVASEELVCDQIMQASEILAQSVELK